MISRDALIAAMSNGYRSLRDIARQFGVSYETIRLLLKKYRITRPLSPEGSKGNRGKKYPGAGTAYARKKAAGVCTAISKGCLRVPGPGRFTCDACAQTKRARDRQRKALR